MLYIPLEFLTVAYFDKSKLLYSAAHLNNNLKVAIAPSDSIGNGHFTQELIGSKENPFQSIQKKLKTSLKAIKVKAAHKSPEVTQLVTTKI
jgi:hypothetical protein